MEKELAAYVTESRFEAIPEDVIGIAKNTVLTNLGTLVAGSTAEGCEALLHQIRIWGGTQEATILMHGDKVPAHNAALMNAFMARAVELDDAVAPGMHLGASTVFAALGAAESIGGCSGKTFLEALVFGTELALKLNLEEQQYDGFDPTGVCAVFGCAAIAGKVMGLSGLQMHHALGLAFNYAGGSLQSNVDGALAVRLIQGFTAQNGIICAQFAKNGITGPEHFLNGVYGYFHLYGKDNKNCLKSVDDLGEQFKMRDVLFKKFPSCAGTFAGTEGILILIKEHDLKAEDIERIEIKLTPFIYRLVGSEFTVGNTPKVNAQFSVRYCVANALLRRSSMLEHFEETAVKDPMIIPIIQLISVYSDPALEKRGHTAMDLRVLMKDGTELSKSINVAPGFPGNPLTHDEHIQRFLSCAKYGKNPIKSDAVRNIMVTLEHLEELEDVREIVSYLA